MELGLFAAQVKVKSSKSMTSCELCTKLRTFKFPRSELAYSDARGSSNTAYMKLPRKETI